MISLERLRIPSEIELEDDEGNFWIINFEDQRAEYYSGGSAVKQSAGVQALKGDEIYIIRSQATPEILLAPVNTENIYRLTSGGELDVCMALTRTNLVNEGFDYLDCFILSDQVICAYEHGLVVFNEDLQIVWQYQFNELMVPPELTGTELKYQENFKDVLVTLAPHFSVQELPTG